MTIYKTTLKISLGLAFVSFSACTGQLMDSFRYQQQQLAFTSEVEVNTKIDLLWVVDNSSSMDVSQKALRDKFEGFTRQYLKPYWDIRIAVITTDTYLANPVFSRYVSTTLNGSVGYKSLHLSNSISAAVAGGATVDNDSRLAKLAAGNVVIADSPGAGGTAGVFSNGLSYGDLFPLLKRGEDYARLLPGMHDGPVPGFCTERSAYFLAEDNAASYPLVAGPQCKVRDFSVNRGPERCLRPGAGESSVSQCVNTTLNDTVRSGRAIIETKPPEGTAGDEAWIQSLVDAFAVNISTGSAGGGSERGLGSVLEFVRVNEAEGSATRFFRPGATHGIIFLTDEDDQTMPLPDVDSVATGPVFTPDADYRCDLPSLAASNVVSTDPTRDTLAEAQTFVTTTMRYCCAGGSCTLEDKGCRAKTVDGFTYTPGVCPDETKLLDPTDVKRSLDTFFGGLEAGGESSYFVVAITPTSAATIDSLQAARFQSDARVGDMPYFRALGTGPFTYVQNTQQRIRLRAVDEGTRYLALVNEVQNGSLSLDIGEPDYSKLLDSIGLTLVQKKSRFPLNREATSKSDMIVKVMHADGSETVVRADQYEIDGRSVVITDTAFVLSLASTDQIVINYQPNSAD